MEKLTVVARTPCALYARVSTRDKQDPETQLGPLRAYAAARGWSVIAEFVDVGYSGSKDSRPALDHMMARARRGEVGAVVVARFDRFARSTRHLIQALEEFRLLSVDFISVNEAIDTSTPVGRMIFTVIAAVAELERSIILERIHAGLDRARKQGKKLGPPVKIVDRDAVRRHYAACQSLRKTADNFGIGKDTCRKIVVSEKQT